jgi:hypothetical protein
MTKQRRKIVEDDDPKGSILENKYRERAAKLIWPKGSVGVKFTGWLDGTYKPDEDFDQGLAMAERVAWELARESRRADANFKLYEDIKKRYLESLRQIEKLGQQTESLEGADE